MRTLIRLLINFLLIAVVILIFRHFGWIDFLNPPEIVNDQTLNDIILAGVIGFLMFIIGEIAGVAFTIFAVMTCGIGCLLYPIFLFLLGYIKLIGTQLILTNWFVYDPIWWKVIIMSIVVGMVRIPSVQERKKIVIKKASNDDD